VENIIIRCDLCTEKECYRGGKRKCPVAKMENLVAEARKLMEREDLKKLISAASLVEKRGYCKWPRLREVAEYAKLLGVRKIGLAFCIGLSSEAAEVAKYFEKKGFKVHAVCCKCGGVDKTEVGMNDSDKLKPGSFEAICNPILQALVLNKLGTELNVTIGLCVGHDAVFSKLSKAPVVCLIAKDRVTGHNPAAAIYVNYLKKKL